MLHSFVLRREIKNLLLLCASLVSRSCGIIKESFYLLADKGKNYAKEREQLKCSFVKIEFYVKEM